MRNVTLSKLVGSILAIKDPGALPIWHPVDQPYPRLLDFDPAAAGLLYQDGIYAIWHLGVRPQWLRVGATANLGGAFGEIARATWIGAFHGNKGVFIAWAMPPPDQCAGIARFLAAKLQPAFQRESFPGDRSLDHAVQPIAWPLPPGTQSENPL